MELKVLSNKCRHVEEVMSIAFSKFVVDLNSSLVGCCQEVFNEKLTLLDKFVIRASDQLRLGLKNL
jgi:hypothetical protein